MIISISRSTQIYSSMISYLIYIICTFTLIISILLKIASSSKLNIFVTHSIGISDVIVIFSGFIVLFTYSGYAITKFLFPEIKLSFIEQIAISLGINILCAGLITFFIIEMFGLSKVSIFLIVNIVSIPGLLYSTKNFGKSLRSAKMGLRNQDEAIRINTFHFFFAFSIIVIPIMIYSIVGVSNSFLFTDIALAQSILNGQGFFDKPFMGYYGGSGYYINGRTSLFFVPAILVAIALFTTLPLDVIQFLPLGGFILPPILYSIARRLFVGKKASVGYFVIFSIEPAIKHLLYSTLFMVWGFIFYFLVILLFIIFYRDNRSELDLKTLIVVCSFILIISLSYYSTIFYLILFLIIFYLFMFLSFLFQRLIVTDTSKPPLLELIDIKRNKKLILGVIPIVAGFLLVFPFFLNGLTYLMNATNTVLKFPSLIFNRIFVKNWDFRNIYGYFTYVTLALPLILFIPLLRKDKNLRTIKNIKFEFFVVSSLAILAIVNLFIYSIIGIDDFKLVILQFPLFSLFIIDYGEQLIKSSRNKEDNNAKLIEKNKQKIHLINFSKVVSSRYVMTLIVIIISLSFSIKFIVWMWDIEGEPYNKIDETFNFLDNNYDFAQIVVLTGISEAGSLTVRAAQKSAYNLETVWLDEYWASFIRSDNSSEYEKLGKFLGPDHGKSFSFILFSYKSLETSVTGGGNWEVIQGLKSHLQEAEKRGDIEIVFSDKYMVLYSIFLNHNEN